MVVAGAGERLSVGRKGHAIYAAGVSLAHGPQSRRRDIPQPHGVIVPRGGQQPPVGREPGHVDVARVLAENRQLPPCFRIPKPGGPVLARRRQFFAVGRIGHAIYGGAVSVNREPLGMAQPPEVMPDEAPQDPPRPVSGGGARAARGLAGGGPSSRRPGPTPCPAHSDIAAHAGRHPTRPAAGLEPGRECWR